MMINIRPHRARITTEFLANYWVEPYPNAWYSSDLSSYDYFLFSKLTNQPWVVHFNSDDEVLDVLDHVIRSLAKEDFQNCFSN